MEHLAIHSQLDLTDFCRKLSILLNLPDFRFDSENETEWGEAKNEYLIINVSRPYEKGTLQEWDNTVPAGCNFGISITKKSIELNTDFRKFLKCHNIPQVKLVCPFNFQWCIL